MRHYLTYKCFTKHRALSHNYPTFIRICVLLSEYSAAAKSNKRNDFKICCGKVLDRIISLSFSPFPVHAPNITKEIKIVNWQERVDDAVAPFTTSLGHGRLSLDTELRLPRSCDFHEDLPDEDGKNKTGG